MCITSFAESVTLVASAMTADRIESRKEEKMSGGERKNDNDNREYKNAYDTARDGGDGSYTFVRFFTGETPSETAGREDGAADKISHGSRE
jgi:hypothetical protein